MTRACLFRDGVMVQAFEPEPPRPKGTPPQPNLNGEIRLLGMQGLGDAFHERSVVRGILRHTSTLQLTTSWPSVFHDMPVQCLPAGSTLPYCAVNEYEERNFFAKTPPYVHTLPLTYLGHELQAGETFMSSMCRRAGVEPVFEPFPVPDAWGAHLPLPREKPWMLFRPLVQRTTFHGSSKRNPDKAAYEAIYNAIKDDYYVISVADLTTGIEHLLTDVQVDLELHSRDLTFRELAWVLSRSALAMSSPGMGLVMGLHIGTPTIGVFGGYESAKTYSDISPLPRLFIEPVNPCCCFDSQHACDKTIDIPAATRRAKEFSDASLHRHHARSASADRLRQPVQQSG